MKQVSGSPFVSAYQISQKTYGWPLGVAWTTVPEIHNRNVEMQTYFEYEISEREKVDGPLDFLEFLTLRASGNTGDLLGPLLTIPLLFLPGVWRRRQWMFLALSGALFAVMLEGAASPHYIAIATAALVAILGESIRHLRAARWGLAGAFPWALVLGARSADRRAESACAVYADGELPVLVLPRRGQPQQGARDA